MEQERKTRMPVDAATRWQNLGDWLNKKAQELDQSRRRVDPKQGSRVQQLEDLHSKEVLLHEIIDEYRSLDVGEPDPNDEADFLNADKETGNDGPFD